MWWGCVVVPIGGVRILCLTLTVDILEVGGFYKSYVYILDVTKYFLILFLRTRG